MRKIDLLGMLLGDSYISPKGVLTTRHSYKQLSYLKFKYEKCKELYPGRTFNLVDVPSQNGSQFGLSDAKLFKRWRRWYYPNGKKYISKKWLNRLTPQAISLWFCDDGSMSYKKKSGKITAVECCISTCCSLEEVKTICDYFNKKWGIVCTPKKIKGKYSVRFGTKAGRMFIFHFGSTIPDCMSYKIDKLIDFTGCYID